MYKNKIKASCVGSIQVPEPYDKEWKPGESGMVEDPSPFERINAWRKEFLATEPEICPERALLWTEMMKETEGQPQIIRNAKALAHVLRNMTIYIGKHELIVGNQASKPRSAPVFPEISYEWFIKEMDEFPFEKRPGDRFNITEDTKEKLRAIAPYWKGRTTHDVAKGLMTEEILRAESAYGKGVFIGGNYFFTGVGHVCAYFPKVFEKGFKGIKKDAEEAYMKLKNPDGTITDPKNQRKRAFYEAVMIVCDAVMDFAKRYADKAREMAEKETDLARKEELLAIAEICEQVPANPARGFWEALQSWWFVQLIIQIESSGHSISPGRFDQYMYPYYKQDIENGVITKELAQELIEHAWMKLNEINKIRDWGSTKAFGGYPMFQNLIVGGKTPEGKDATNELSFMCLDATAHVRLPQPSISVRVHDQSPQEFLIKATKVTKIGLGMPAWYNDEVIIPSLLNRGRSIEDANDYCIIGCVEPDVWGREYGWHDAMFFNLNFCLELALNDGKCINCSPKCPIYDRCVGAGKQLGVKTGKLSDFKTFDEVKEAYEKQVKYFVHLAQEFNNAEDAAHQITKPLPFLSTVVEPCIERGIDVTAGGAKYNYTGPQGVGIANVADGLAAIKKLIFEDKEISGETMLKALQANWEGYEDLRAKIRGKDMPHYGNDDDYADELAYWAALVYCKAMEKCPTAHGGIFQPGLYPVSANVPAGAVQGATPDGRKAGDPVADGISPVHGHDIKGPTAVALSASKIDHLIASNGTLLNMMFSPKALEGTVGDRNFLAMMKVYFDRKAQHVQHNVVSKDMLLAAQKDPDKFAGLVVRVAGYSVFFTSLDKALQDDIIERTELLF